MRIDATIYAAIDAGTLTIDGFLESLGPVFDHVEKKVLIDGAVAAVAAGYADDVVKLMIDEGAHHLRELRSARLETLRQRLECRSISLQ